MSERADIIERAAKAWGEKDPTPDDILMEAFPRYHEHPAHTAGYHEAFSAVIQKVEKGAPRCRRCTEVLPAESNHNRRYCTPCQADVKREYDRDFAARQRRGASA